MPHKKREDKRVEEGSELHRLLDFIETMAMNRKKANEQELKTIAIMRKAYLKDYTDAA